MTLWARVSRSLRGEPEDVDWPTRPLFDRTTERAILVHLVVGHAVLLLPENLGPASDVVGMTIDSPSCRDGGQFAHVIAAHVNP